MADSKLTHRTFRDRQGGPQIQKREQRLTRLAFSWKAKQAGFLAESENPHSVNFPRSADGRLFVRSIPPYIPASLRHPDAPRLTELQREALAWVVRMADDPANHVLMGLLPGDMQFINNYHVLHNARPTRTTAPRAASGT